ncbi:protein kinase, partial [archaeon]|nr:protein kinase [archaeon]
MDQNYCKELMGDKYEVKDHLGGGGCADVYAVTELNSGEGFAARIVRLPMLQAQEAKEVALSEEKILRSGCPFIVGIHELLFKEGYSIFILEKGDCNLEYKIAKLSEDESLKAISQSCSALLHVYSNFGCAHLDIKPSNILCFKEQGMYKLADFSFARHAFGMMSGLTSFKSISFDKFIGTILYHPPEFSREFSKEELTEKVDSYALGITLAQCLSNKSIYLFANSIKSFFNVKYEAQFSAELAKRKADGDLSGALLALCTKKNFRLKEIINSCIEPEKNARICVSELQSEIQGYQKRRIFIKEAIQPIRDITKIIHGQRQEPLPLCSLQKIMEKYCSLSLHARNFPEYVDYRKIIGENIISALLSQIRAKASLIKDIQEPVLNMPEQKSLLEFFRHSLDYKKQRLELEVFIAITNLFSDFAN